MNERTRRIVKILTPIAGAGLLLSACAQPEPNKRQETPRSSTTDVVAPTYIPSSEIPILLVQPNLTVYTQPENPNVARHVAYIQRWCRTGRPSIQNSSAGPVMVFSTEVSDCPATLRQRMP